MITTNLLLLLFLLRVGGLTVGGVLGRGKAADALQELGFEVVGHVIGPDCQFNLVWCPRATCDESHVLLSSVEATTILVLPSAFNLSTVLLICSTYFMYSFIV